MLQAPEMVRIPLEELVLQIHSLGLGPAAQFFERVLEPPPAKSILSAIAQLSAVGALSENERLTPLGAAAAVSCQGHMLFVRLWRGQHCPSCIRVSISPAEQALTA